MHLSTGGSLLHRYPWLSISGILNVLWGGVNIVVNEAVKAALEAAQVKGALLKEFTNYPIITGSFL